MNDQGQASQGGQGSELGRYLRAKRAAVQPEDVGLPPGTGRRRTPGLRREELATLAGVSIDYYTRLERGRETNPSPAVVDALADVLQLSDDAYDHLRTLAEAGSRGPRADRRRKEPARSLRPGIRQLLETLRPSPAYVVTRTNDLIAANPAGLRLYHGLADWPASRRNMTRYLFLHPAAREVFTDWADLLPGSVAHLRALAGADPVAPELTQLVGELAVKSKEFARLWERYEVCARSSGTKRFRHPEVGAMSLNYEQMTLARTDGQRLIVYQATPGSPDHDALVLLDMASSTAASESETALG
ncbi:helix-turn-helix transcriptional regulator [Streptomyces sp. A7024]|uniref:Helix-turn-helix transcriptional regulator n=1 Tax=Streptomyces coryli TaxID=1128680 RepID=A0A6G4U5N2_9ACTN|nr:helix-turn-helix transcriptional regulator [Streptomyces coryli]NGN67545.1 helix-turn-helix transcriptional regulator [Streptomyces coryli]